MSMNQIIRAANFAKRAHGSQKRKYSGDPYYFHPIRVAARVSTLDDVTEEMVVAAFLHDVVEDTETSLNEIESKFGSKVARYVDELSNKAKKLGISPRTARKEFEFNRLKNVSREVKLIKMIDRIDNLREMPKEAGDFVELYATESLALAKAIGDADCNLRTELIKECGIALERSR